MLTFTRLRQRRKKALPRPKARGRPLRIEQLEDRTLLTLLGQSLFPADNPWNQNISQAPVASNSTAIINAIIGTYGNHNLHPDFAEDDQTAGAPLYGIPYNVVHGDSVPKVSVVIDAYPSESDIEPAPIPTDAVLEGDTQTGPTVGLAKRGDSHLIVYDEDNNIDYEFYHASRPSENSDGMWHADAEAVWNMNTNTFRTIGWTSADAAGLPILPGLVRPDEGLPTTAGGQGAIDHALRFTLENAVILDQFLYPASHIANDNDNPATEPPMGARFRLKASVNISGLDAESQIIAKALQDYGMIVADNGSNFFLSGASYSVNSSNDFDLTWNDNDILSKSVGLESLTFSDFEVVDLTPIVIGLSATSGADGAVVTVMGQNFSGAAGHLEVLFGNTPATSVTVLSDSQVQAAVPAGSGTVNVTVQSGVNDPDDPDNINNPIFGYGVSAVSAADQFTYFPPLVVTAADWTSVGLTLMLGSDGKLHVYKTGTMTDVVTPVAPTSIENIEITAPSNNTANLTINSANGNPIPVGGLTYSGAGGGLIKTGSYPVTLSVPNSFTGGTTVSGGTLILGAVNALPSGGSLTVGAAGVFHSGPDAATSATVVTTAVAITKKAASSSLSNAARILEVPAWLGPLPDGSDSLDQHRGEHLAMLALFAQYVRS